MRQYRFKTLQFSVVVALSLALLWIVVPTSGGFGQSDAEPADVMEQNAGIETEPHARLTGLSLVLDRILTALNRKSGTQSHGLQQLWADAPTVLPDLQRIYRSLGPDKTAGGAFGTLIWIALLVGLGLAAEFVFKRSIIRRYMTEADRPSAPMGVPDIMLTGLVHKVPNLLGLLIFFGVTYALYFAVFGTSLESAQLVFLSVLIVVTFIRFCAILLDFLLSPETPSLRFLSLSDKSARFMYRLILWPLGYIVLAIQISLVVYRLGAGLNTAILILLILATVLVGLSAVSVLVRRSRIEAYALSLFDIKNQPPQWWQQQFAFVSPVLILLYLGGLWILLINDLIGTTSGQGGAFLFSFFVLPIWMVADWLIRWLVRYALKVLKIHQEPPQDDGEVPEDVQRNWESSEALCRKIMLVARLGLILALAIWVASLWNIRIPLVSRLSSVIFDALVIMALALLLWQFISAWIERKIQESTPEETEDAEAHDSEWGSAAQRGRAYTLLPVVRKFIATILVVMVTMTIISAMGIDIGPLLAGAGVVGLALGFGAQKLVADIFSGFFYLLDDAFRVGEYITTAGGVSGTVENITLRNVMLRHHRGMLQIIPHSELGAITNSMRGGIVVKFNLEFAYDADIDRIRKIIKKVGQAMLEDEEMGKDFIRPVKSQGVREITNSVMVIRVKFTANPGAHFVIRREAYKRITEALNKNGIYYAHRKVIVDIPHAMLENATPEQAEQIERAAGAAVQSELASAEASKA